MTLLSINIPTYERLDSFSQIIIELENELNSLEAGYRAQIEIAVFENDSSAHPAKQRLCAEVSRRSNLQIKYAKNATNIGADENIYQCCTANPDATFTWVLGDDDHVVAGALAQIIFFLTEHRNDLGLLVLSDGNYPLHEQLRNKQFPSYFWFAKVAVTTQPHYLIAHTLISENIFRTSIFDSHESRYVTRDLTKRLGLSANFSHMRGMVKGLLSETGKNYCVLTPDFISLDTSKRLPAAVSFDADLVKIYYFYYQWLLTEIGVRVDGVARQSAMAWLFEQAPAMPAH